MFLSIYECPLYLNLKIISHMSYLKYLLIIVVFFPLSLLAQNVDKLESKAEKYFYTEELDEALAIYEQLISMNSRNYQAKYRAEVCSLLTNYRSKPMDVILSYAKTQGRKDKFYNYWMGRIHYRQNHFKKAIKSWKSFLAMKKYKSKELIAETQGMIKRAELAETSFSHPDGYEIEQLPDNINSFSIEYSPVYFDETDELLFLSSVGSSTDEEYQVYHSLRKDAKWNNPTPISNFGNFKKNNANIEVVLESGKLFLYKDQGKGGLYYSELKSGNWSDLVQFDSHLTGKTMDSHFFINKSENRILFAAPGSKQVTENLDLFESVKDANTGKWGAHKLISTNINSIESEDFPFLSHDEKTLFFSSKGHEALGGYDIYKSTLDDSGNWSEPESLGYPVNTQDDDIQFKINSESNSGYFVSNRLETNGGFDIFFFHEANKVYLDGIVTDSNGEPVDHGILVFTPERGTNLIAKISTDEKGYYKVKLGADDVYKIEISFHEEVVLTETFDTPAHGSVQLITKDFKLAREKEVLKAVDETEHAAPTFTEIEKIATKFRHTNKVKLDNVYFEKGSHTLKSDSETTLLVLYSTLKEFPKLVVEIGGHTDNIGTEESNLNISKLRAESVAKYLTDKGINDKQLQVKGYGESKPIASNDDEENGRELNRRIEVLVIE
jgi:outer membrane protein OmpA-like peptidoglycan-associated protein/tetratricopeptide (TPR) repeat protein